MIILIKIVFRNALTFKKFLPIVITLHFMLNFIRIIKNTPQKLEYPLRTTQKKIEEKCI